MVKVRNRQALNKAKIQTDLDGIITQSIDGLEGIVAIAQAEGAQEMLNVNSTLTTSDPLITEPTKQYISVQKEDLSQFARKVSRVATVPKEGDTEVVLAAYDYWGEECVQYFNGMWSFAIYDKKSKKVHTFHIYSSFSHYILTKSYIRPPRSVPCCWGLY